MQSNLITTKKAIPFQLKVICKIHILYGEMISFVQKLEEKLKPYQEPYLMVKDFRECYETVEYYLTKDPDEYESMNNSFLEIDDSSSELKTKFKDDSEQIQSKIELLMKASIAITMSSAELAQLELPSGDSVITIIRANITSLISEYQLILDTQTAEEQLGKHKEIIVALSELNNLVANGFLLNPEFYNLLDKIIQDISSCEKAVYADTEINRMSHINFLKAIKKELKKSQNQDFASDIAKAQKLVAYLISWIDMQENIEEQIQELEKKINELENRNEGFPSYIREAKEKALSKLQPQEVADLKALKAKKKNIEEQIQELEKKINELENRNEGFPSYIREAKEKALSNIKKPTWADNIAKEKVLAKSRRSPDKEQNPECHIF